MSKGVWAILGGLVLAGVAVASGGKKKVSTVTVDEPPKPPKPKARDWSGCGEPPDYCQPRPRFKCGDRVLVDLDGFDKGRAYTINARTWGPLPDDPAKGLWMYAFAESDSYTEEANLAPATSPAAKPAAPAPAPAPKPPVPAAAPVPAVVASLPKPMYPAGLEAKLGDVTVTIGKAWLDGQGGAHYEVAIKGTPLGLKDEKAKAVSEGYLRETLAKQTKQKIAADQLFPQGVSVFRNGQGGKIEKVVRDAAGGWTYQVAGWGDVVPQAKLLSILTGAA